MENRNKIEAILFITGRFLSVNEIGSMTGIKSENFVKQALEDLSSNYNSNNSALQIINQENKWKLNVKKEFLHLTDNLLSDSEFDRPTQETLAIVAYKNPVLQAEVIKIRGNKAYDHIKSMREGGFITSEKNGRTRLLKLTPKFFEYFDVMEDSLKLKNEEK